MGARTMARESRKDIVIRVDAIPEPDDDKRNLQGRNSLEWLEEGYVDWLFAMDYRPMVRVGKIAELRATYGQGVILLADNYIKRSEGIVPRDRRDFDALMRNLAA